MRLSVKHEGNVRFTASCRGHEITMDQPLDNHGDDAGMTPPEIFASSLAGCVGFYVAQYCKKAGLATEGLRIDMDWKMAQEPYRIGSIDMQIVLPGLPENRQRAIHKVAETCLLHATLLHAPQMNTTILTD